MRTILKGVVSVCVLTMTLVVMPVSTAKAADTETYVHKAPDFTLTVPMWKKIKSLNPLSVLCETLTPM